jgi:uncharacterized protein YprB with RNaseH-like and TPR domain
VPLDSSRLSSRVRELLRGNPAPAGAHDEARQLDNRDVPETRVREVRFVPDDEVPIAAETATGCVVIERHYGLDMRHGRATVRDYREAAERHVSALAVLSADPQAAGATTPVRPARFEWDRRGRHTDERRSPGVPTSGPLLYFDLETTGLSGGVGTLAFLVGCGYFDADGFHTRQYFLSGYEAEHDLLRSLATFTGQFSGLVSFNGRSFDVPLIDMRYAFHRLDSPFETMPHFDMLHPARRLWRRREPTGLEAPGEWALTPPGSDGASCALKSLEEAILGTGRVGDVPGSEIPGRYFQYLRSGYLEPLQAVFEHNRLDLLSLAALTAHAARMTAGGPSALPTPHESLAMGQVYERIDRAAEAEACYVRAAGLGDAPWAPKSVERDIRIDALRRLAVMRRRQRRFLDAASAWEAVLDAGVDRASIQEARRALAIHHEHRTRDLDSARRFAESALETEQDPDRVKALRYRIDRLNRKTRTGDGRAGPTWHSG